MVSRSEVIQNLLALYDAPSYLEIGVNRGVTFHAIRARRKVAVDPKFLFDRTMNAADEYHEVTSDEYFASFCKYDDIFEVIYLDGLHTFEQTLRDLMNAIAHIATDGLIVIDDVLPNNYAASLPDPALAAQIRLHLGLRDPSWMGDVYKLVFFIRTFLPSWSYATISDNHGQLILWPQTRAAADAPVLKLSELAALEFSDTIINRDAYLFESFVSIRSRISHFLSAKPRLKMA